ncbi:MAG: FKBP-type peptidyl-prolyl cis-trans isomerase [Cyclobacteriaceae bacterium]|nr:FKBP-type peptidyl-prolyl cis-trans isomerase [Cyclobacteriaceae bacterium]
MTYWFFSKYFCLALLLFVVSGCLKDDTCTRTVSQSRINAVNQTKLQSDIELIDAHIAQNNIQNVVVDPSGIRYTIDVQGQGDQPCLESAVTVTYRGTFLSSGNEFDKSISPVTFSLSGLILGWQIILPKIKRGSSITLFLPSGYGYGNVQVGSIPPNSNLVFEIDLL